ncbi:MAG: carboxypeptidase regulatory-like domain-containing protein, partial [Myxococcales bacterium]|nr:carboxypeptidase regulatory-like domain-containing protein [Myxococcales bacterium]
MRRGWARWGVIGLLLLAAAAAVAWLWVEAPAPGKLVDGGEGGEVVTPTAVTPAARRILGRVLLESLAAGTGPEGQVPENSPAGPLTAPAPGSCVARAWRNEQFLAEASCADDGSFALALAVTEAVAVEMLVPGRLRAVLTAPATEADVQLPTVALGPASSLRGEVIDRQGRPVVGAEVAALPLPNLGEPEPWRVRSGPDGGFVLDTLPEGPIRLRVTRAGHALTITDAYAPEAGVVVVLDEMLGLQGAVIGEPAIAARAKVRLEGSSLWPPLVQPVRADGSFEFAELVDGVYGLVATVEAATPGGQE